MSTESKFAYAMAKRLADNQISLEAKHNTIFTAIEEFGQYNELTYKALEGLTNIVKRDVETFRNEILPVAEEYEKEVKAKATLKSPSILDKIKLHVYTKSEITDIMKGLGIVDQNISYNIKDLPQKPLIISYREEDAKEALIPDNLEYKQQLESILSEYPENYLEQLHLKYFSNVSANGIELIQLAYNPIDKFNDIVILFALVDGYIKKDLGVYNMSIDEAKGYLRRVKMYLNGLIVNYIKMYDEYYLARNILVVSVKEHKYRHNSSDQAEYDIYLIGEVYEKYLEDHSVEGLIGLAKTVSEDQTNFKLDEVIENYDHYMQVYEEMIRLESIKKASERINLLRLAYKIVLQEKADELGIKYIDIKEASDKYIDSLSNDELLELTKHARYIVSVFLFDSEEFLFFTESMEYYSKLFPNQPVEKIAFMATVALVIRYLQPQIEVSRGF